MLLRCAQTLVAVLILMLLSVTAAAQSSARPRLVRGGGDSHAGYLTAAAAGAEYALPAGATVRLAPGTAARVLHTPQMLKLDAGPKYLTYSVLLRRGRVEARVPVTAESRTAVLVSAPRKTRAIAMSGSLLVTTESGSVSVASIDAKAITKVGSDWLELKPGTARTRGSDRSKRGARQLPAAPGGVTGQTVWMALTGPASVKNIRWNPVPNVAEYVVTLSRVGESAPPQTVRTKQSKLATALRIPPGVYDLRVRAEDFSGFPGKTSAPLRINVVGVRIPPGARAVDNGVIQLSRGQAARLPHTDGLKLSYRGAKKNPSASTPVGLDRGERRVIALVRPTTLDLATVRLEPSPVQVHVEAEPRNPVWPEQPITITVTARDAHGRPAPPWFKPVAKVTLGIDPIRVRWRRSGDALRARVLPRVCDTQCVLRVEVRDQRGVTLDRDFVEIVENRRARVGPRAAHNK